MPAGRVAARDFVCCVVELSFGLGKAVTLASEAGAEHLSRLSQVEMDLTWCGAEVASLAATELGHACTSRLPGLRVLKVCLAGCSAIQGIGDLGYALAGLTRLQELSLDFRR